MNFEIEHIAGTGASVGTLSSGVTFVYDTADSAIVETFNWNPHSHGYIVSRKAGYLHRVIAKPAAGLIVDHDNHDKTDCRRGNLRDATYSQNGANRRAQKSASLSFKGIFRRGDKFRAKIVVQGKQYHLGSYDTQEAAHAAYCAGAAKHFGEFAHA